MIKFKMAETLEAVHTHTHTHNTFIQRGEGALFKAHSLFKSPSKEVKC